MAKLSGWFNEHYASGSLNLDFKVQDESMVKARKHDESQRVRLDTLDVPQSCGRSQDFSDVEAAFKVWADGISFQRRYSVSAAFTAGYFAALQPFSAPVDPPADAQSQHVQEIERILVEHGGIVLSTGLTQSVGMTLRAFIATREALVERAESAERRAERQSDALRRLREYAQHKPGCDADSCLTCSRCSDFRNYGGGCRGGKSYDSDDCSNDKYGTHLFVGIPCTCGLADTLLATEGNT